MYRKLCISFLLLIITSTLGSCNRKSVNQSIAKQLGIPEVPGSVFFRIARIDTKSENGSNLNRWLATHEKEGKIAKFRIELTLKALSADSPFSISTGSFYREEDSNSSIFLKELAKALEAKKIKSTQRRIDKLIFTVAIIGMNLSRGEGKDMYAGAFTSEPRGDWIAAKVFVADGEGEFFLNLNPVFGIGEIAIKDPEYGNIVLKELSKVI
jgi:hypothetical protein